ncbi:MAG: hypothetical protein MUQ32_07110 [Chloroflexi bacterium]|nr:hypothetical protein [Chloroflexota bacterium]
MIDLLLRLYPPRWRDRYGDEFASVLEERPLGPFDVADVLLGALDAHLHLRGLGAASQHAKGFAMSLRIGGYAAIISGLLWLYALAGNAINDGAESGAPFIGIVLVVATITTLVALVGLSAFQARRHPVLTWTAFAVPAIGAIVALLGVVALTIAGDSDAEVIGGLSPWAISTLGLLTLLVGSALFAVATWRSRGLSRGAAALLGIGALLIFPALMGVTGGLVPEALVGPVMLTAILAYPAGWMALGISALRVGPATFTSLEGASL